METTTQTKKDTQPSIPSKEIIIHRVLNLPVQKVWEAWSEPDNYKEWWGPKGYTCPYATVNFKVGGTYLSCMRSPKGEDFWSTGVYQEIVPFKKIVMTDSFADADGNVLPASAINMPGDWPDELLVTLTLEEADGITKLKLQHEGIPGEMYDDCIKGWNESLDKLEKI